MSSLDGQDWFDPDLLPDWSDIHESAMQEARKVAAGMHDWRNNEDRVRLSDNGVPVVAGTAVATSEFMRTVGFDARYIAMLTAWVDEQRRLVAMLMENYLSEIQTSCEALDNANTDNEEITNG